MNLQTIQYGDWSAVVNLSRGANCISLRNEKYGVRLLREPDRFEGKLDNPYLYGMPILFPVNRISGGRFTFEGREYRFPINEPATGCHLHGTLHQTAFELVERSEERILCAYRATRESPYLDFPHGFEIRMEYRLGEDGLTHTTQVTNLSDTNMPCLLGFHTTFNASFAGTRETLAQVDFAEEYERNMKNYLPTGQRLAPDAVSRALKEGSFSPFSQPISRHYRADGQGRLSLTDPEKRLRLVYETDPKFGFRLIYNGQADGYICLEPQTCLANAPNAPFAREETGFDWIEPKQSKLYDSKISLTEDTSL